jgi:hypothetical protein
VYTPDALEVVEPPLQLTVAPDKAAPVEALVIVPVTVPVPGGVDPAVNFTAAVAPLVTVTGLLWVPLLVVIETV